MERITLNGVAGVFYSEEELAMLGLRFIESPSPAPNTFKLHDLRFFKDFNTIEKQQVLKRAILYFFTKACPEDGKEFSPLYIAHSFHTNKLKLSKKYADFFHDIDLIAPGRLSKVKQDQRTNQERYKSYCQSLPKECKKWFIVDGYLPPLNEWTLSSKYTYQVDKDIRKQRQSLTIELLKEFKSKEAKLA